MTIDMLISTPVLGFAVSSVPDIFGSTPLALGSLAIAGEGLRSVILRRPDASGPSPAFSRPATIAWIAWPVAFWFLSVFLARWQPAFFLRATAEDGWIENAQVVLLLAGVGLSIVLGRRCLRRGLGWWSAGFFAFALLLFAAAGEEISWGQRLFNLDTPAWAAANTQQEMNLHNLPQVADTLSDLTDDTLMLTVILSIACGFAGADRSRRLHAPFWVVPPALCPGLCCTLSYGSVLYHYQEVRPAALDAISELQEPREFILYAAVCGFLWSALRHERSLPPATE